MLFLFFAAGVAPVAAAFGVVFWRRFVRGEPLAGTLAWGVALGLAGGVLLGVTVASVVLLLVTVLLPIRGH